MTNYRSMDREFIARTLEVLDQYQELAQPRLPEDKQREVTLLLNCMMGLLIYPKELAQRGDALANNWLTKDRVAITGPDWGIKLDYIKNPGFKERKPDSDGNVPRSPIDRDEMTMRQLLRQMRNTIAHGNFHVQADGAENGQITTIVFENRPKGEDFHMELPVTQLEQFTRKLAASALAEIDRKSQHQKG